MKNLISNFFKDNYQLFFQHYLKELESLSGDEYRAICAFHEDTKGHNPYTFIRMRMPIDWACREQIL
jgi:hypothetical protein